VSQRQASRLTSYAVELVRKSPTMAAMVERLTYNEMETSTGASLVIEANSWRSARGGSSPLQIVDEICAMRGIDSALSDEELLTAKRPTLATMSGMLCCLGSPMDKSGVGYDACMQYGDNHDKSIMVVRQPTMVMHPSEQIARVVARAHDRDPLTADSEWGNDTTIEFRPDMASFIDRDEAQSCVSQGVYELPYDSERQYAAFADPSGGSGRESFGFAITYNDNGVVVVAKVVEIRPTFKPSEAIATLADICKQYHVYTIMSHRYGGSFPQEHWELNQIHWEESERTKSQIYQDSLALLNSGKVRLLDNKRLFHQLINLQVKSGHGTGRLTIDHPPNGLNDLINATCGAILLSDVAMSGAKQWERMGENGQKFLNQAFGRWRVRNAPTGFRGSYGGFWLWARNSRRGS